MIVQSFSKIGQTVLEISQFFDFYDGRRSPSRILKFWNFWLTVILGSLMCINVPNFTKIIKRLLRYGIQQFTKWRPSAILDFEILKFLVFHQFGSAKMHHRTKFHQSRSNGYRDIALNVFQNGGRPSSWIFIKSIFWTFLRVRRDNMRQLAKFRINRSNGCWNIASYPFFQDGGCPPFWIRGANSGTTHNENLTVFITVQNLVAIALVVLKIQKCEYFARLA